MEPQIKVPMVMAASGVKVGRSWSKLRIRKINIRTAKYQNRDRVCCPKVS